MNIIDIDNFIKSVTSNETFYIVNILLVTGDTFKVSYEGTKEAQLSLCEDLLHNLGGSQCVLVAGASHLISIINPDTVCTAVIREVELNNKKPKVSAFNEIKAWLVRIFKKGR